MFTQIKFWRIGVVNIFATSKCPVKSARQHCDVHIRKMIVETAQLLSTAHVMCDGIQVAYKKTHHNHPCGVWIRESASNYRWAFNMLEAMLIEYEYRFEKTHRTGLHLEALRAVPTMVDRGLTPFAQAMPEHLRDSDAHKAYRRYLKIKFTEWSQRDRPVLCTYTRREVPKFARDVATRIIPFTLLYCKKETRYAPA